jgi:hypothetical protein
MGHGKRSSVANVRCALAGGRVRSVSLLRKNEIIVRPNVYMDVLQLERRTVIIFRQHAASPHFGIVVLLLCPVLEQICAYMKIDFLAFPFSVHYISVLRRGGYLKDKVHLSHKWHRYNS